MSEDLHKNPEFPEELPYIRVLDHGFVALVDVMGTDSSIVQAARVSYGKGTKTVRSDKALISYLARHSHTTPFEMIEFKFLMRLPVFIARQVIRHRTASVNEYSARYSLVPDRFWVPDLGAIADQDPVNRQGRRNLLQELTERLPEPAEKHACAFFPEEPAVLVAADGKGISRRGLLDPESRGAFTPSWSRGEVETHPIPTSDFCWWVAQLLEFFPEERDQLETIREIYREQNRSSYAMYQDLIERGVAREIARSVLPLSMYTEWYWKMDLHNLLHFLRLRMDAHAQLEVRAFAEACAVYVKEHAPFVWEAFSTDLLQGARLSGVEREAIAPKGDAAQRAYLTALHEGGYRRRRLKESCRKLDIDERLVDEMWPPKR